MKKFLPIFLFVISINMFGFEAKHFGKYSSFNSIVSNDSLIFISHSNGLIKYNIFTKQKKIYDVFNSNLQSNQITTLFFDSLENLWISTMSYGIAKMDKFGKITAYKTNKEIIGQFPQISSAYKINENGDIVIISNYNDKKLLIQNGEIVGAYDEKINKKNLENLLIRQRQIPIQSDKFKDLKNELKFLTHHNIISENIKTELTDFKSFMNIYDNFFTFDDNKFYTIDKENDKLKILFETNYKLFSSQVYHIFENTFLVSVSEDKNTHELYLIEDNVAKSLGAIDNNFANIRLLDNGQAIIQTVKTAYILDEELTLIHEISAMNFNRIASKNGEIYGLNNKTVSKLNDNGTTEFVFNIPNENCGIADFFSIKNEWCFVTSDEINIIKDGKVENKFSFLQESDSDQKYHNFYNIVDACTINDKAFFVFKVERGELTQSDDNRDRCNIYRRKTVNFTYKTINTSYSFVSYNNGQFIEIQDVKQNWFSSFFKSKKDNISPLIYDEIINCVQYNPIDEQLYFGTQNGIFKGLQTFVKLDKYQSDIKSIKFDSKGKLFCLTETELLVPESDSLRIITNGTADIWNKPLHNLFIDSNDTVFFNDQKHSKRNIIAGTLNRLKTGNKVFHYWLGNKAILSPRISDIEEDKYNRLWLLSERGITILKP